MSEITKLYENAGFVQKRCKDYSCIVCDKNKDCNKYPPFTAEKQLKLIEFFISSVWWMNLKSLYKTLDYSLNFEDKLAKMVNYLWQSLTEEEKQQVKGILE